ncbi:selenide, water dikinase SelD [Sulfitobacter aestuariivivens]|uniref:selenide, water dikinase SelD n=1 Tax=Sulfitobacter aestuariivivens TaxID=2766981 RepID=UPI0031B61989
MPLTRDLVLVGGGHAHALVLRAWGMDPLPGARLTVINPGPTAPYTGMLPGHVAGHYGRDELEIDLVRLCQHAGARLILGKAVALDRVARRIDVEGWGAVAYDVASVDIGITAEMDLPGFAAHGVGAKPLDVFAARWRDFRDRAGAGDVPAEIAVIGGGVAGCEVSMAMAFALRARGVTPAVTVIEAGPQITVVTNRGREIMLEEMAALGVKVRCDAVVEAVTADTVRIAGQSDVAARFTVGAAGAFAHDWLAQTDLPLVDGFIEVGSDLGVKGDERLFAVGDCAHMAHAPRPKAGVFAVRAAPVLKHNLRAALSGGVRREFRPQRDYLKLISLGGKSAMAEKFGRVFRGGLMWQWKDRIDRAFMDRLENLPAMAVAPVPGEVAGGVRDMLAAKPLCGGCGAKVGGGVLAGALADVVPVEGDILAGAGDDAAILKGPDGTFQVISTDHLRSFIADPVMMTRIALVHALGDVWAMGAAPQALLSSIVLPQMSPELQARTLEEITRTVTGLLGEVGGQLVGGHTTMGAELTIGFTVTGTTLGQPITHAGAQVGDALVLTRPIGSGVILAAHMQGQARGPDVTRLLEIMAQPQDRAAQALAGAHAMTDVTGFGLAGHALAIARASGVDLVLNGGDIPVYEGARALSAAGVASTLLAANRADAPAAGSDDPLLHDPQTAGGLLAAVRSEDVAGVLEALRVTGGEGHIIGRVEEGPGQVRVS